ncbi:hypothetical protein DERF_008269 [Dermatophagoides farinae]|uniref:Uncharacterized protein n=1 Tax=Dermatophagoides farinae TaxID=6954 RepID=A0A922HZL4_DERFA|nr:hypothetical protein DERF_008269 [Dermatophagoides farinae]
MTNIHPILSQVETCLTFLANLNDTGLYIILYYHQRRTHKICHLQLQKNGMEQKRKKTLKWMARVFADQNSSKNGTNFDYQQQQQQQKIIHL